MDHFISILLQAVAFAGVCLFWCTWRPLLKWRVRKVPGGWGFPLLGHIPCFAPHMDIATWVEQQCLKFPIAFQMWLGGKCYVVVSSHEMGRKLLMRYRERPDMRDLALWPGEDYSTWNSGILFLHGPKWRVVRKAFEAAVMNPKNLAAQAPNVSRCADFLCAQLQLCAQSGQPLDVLPLVYTMTMDAVGFAAFGLDLEATKSYKVGSLDAAADGRWWAEHSLGSPQWSQSFVRCAVGVMQSMSMSELSTYQLVVQFFPPLLPLVHKLSEWLPDSKTVKHNKNFEGLRQGCNTIIQAWRKQRCNAGEASGISENGFLPRLLEVVGQADGEVQLTDHDVVGNAIMMVVAGYETTGSAIGSALHLLTQNMQVQLKAQAELDDVLKGKEATPEDIEKLPYLQAVVQETLRLRNSAVAAVRVVGDSSLDLGQGITVPKGTHLWAPLSFYQQDPQVWPDANRFIPERHLAGAGASHAPSTMNAMMPFGHGPRQCVGYKFALLEAHLGLARVLQRFAFEAVPGAPPPKWRTSLATSPDTIMVVVNKR